MIEMCIAHSTSMGNVKNAMELKIVRVEAVNRVKSEKNYKDVKFHRALLKYKGSRLSALKGFGV